jgi:allantoin racemase
VIQSNTFDPGVEASRLAVRIPMVGVFRATLHTAATLCDRIAITVPLDGHVTHTWRILRSYGMEDFVEDIRPIGIYGEALITRKDELYGRTVDLMKALKNETRAQMLLPLGGALIPYVVSPDDLAKEVGLPVLNTKAIGIRFAETLVGLGMAHSPRAYPNAGLKPEDFTQKAFA